MSCATCREHLDELASGELPPRLCAELTAHIEVCPACARLLDETKATLSLLHRLGEEPLPAGFGAELHRKLVAAPPPAPPGRLARLRDGLRDLLLARPIAGGLAAAALAAMLILPVALRHPIGGRGVPVAAGEVPPIFVVPREKVAVVRIDFHAEVPVDDVEFAIQLPEGLHFVSEGRELPDREFRWRGRLAQGSNPIPVAVRGRRAGRYTLVAHAAGADVTAKHTVVLEVRS